MGNPAFMQKMAELRWVGLAWCFSFPRFCMLQNPRHRSHHPGGPTLGLLPPLGVGADLARRAPLPPRPCPPPTAHLPDPPPTHTHTAARTRS